MFDDPVLINMSSNSVFMLFSSAFTKSRFLFRELAVFKLASEMKSSFYGLTYEKLLLFISEILNDSSTFFFEREEHYRLLCSLASFKCC